MEYLFIELMLWGQDEGYARSASAWRRSRASSGASSRRCGNRSARWCIRHGEHFYNFQGLREYKEKFDPVWEPRYLASPGGLALPRVLANVASLISGGCAASWPSDWALPQATRTGRWKSPRRGDVWLPLLPPLSHRLPGRGLGGAGPTVWGMPFHDT